ncbi:PP2C family protein-serine/threonine phosphatase [Kitasatospora sp. NPDC059571]|uniref:PP2C family protein-serine/threonine phosphatase n=1 Tax=Kitasatospora sp. NPDC059571 TaxID=3346871 RepID=UPI0036C710A1
MHIGRRWTRRTAVDTGARNSTPAAAEPSAAPGRNRTPEVSPPPGLLGSLLTGSAAGAVVLGTDLLVREASDGFAALAGEPAAELLGRSASSVPLLADRVIQQVLHAVLEDGLSRPFRALLGPAGTARTAAAPTRAADGPGAGTGPRGPQAAPGPAAAAGTCHRLVAGGRTVGLGIILVAGPAADGPVEDGAEGAGPAGDGPVAASATALRHARRRLALLDEATGKVGTTLDMDTTCAELARFAVPRLADLATVDVIPVTGTATAAVGRPAAAGRLHRAGLARVPALAESTGALATPGERVRHRPGTAPARSLAEHRPVLADLRATAAGGAAADRESEACRSAGLGAVLAVPLIARDRTTGVLTLARAASAPDFSQEDVELAEDLARRAAVAIDNARHYARSQGITLELQRALLTEPGNPHPNLDLASRYLPSGTSSVVGGDWFEAVRLSFGRTLLVIGDVMGHGVEAAVDMSDYRAMLRYVAGTDLPPHRILRQLDTLIAEKESARPATCLLALADPARNRCTYASAGHLPPALIVPGRGTELVRIPTGPPLGTGLGGYEPAVGTLNPDEVVLMYTDGLVERRDEDIDASLARLADLHLPVAGDLDDLLDSVVHGLAPRVAEDDIAVLAARVRPR